MAPKKEKKKPEPPKEVKLEYDELVKTTSAFPKIPYRPNPKLAKELKVIDDQQMINSAEGVIHITDNLKKFSMFDIRIGKVIDCKNYK